jgi:putative heme transporter
MEMGAFTGALVALLAKDMASAIASDMGKEVSGATKQALRRLGQRLRREPATRAAMEQLETDPSDPAAQERLVGIAGLVAAIVVFALLLRSEDQARRFGLLAGRVASRLRRLIGRGPVSGWELATVKFRARTIDLVTHRWISITVWSLVSHLSLYLVLLVCLRDVGVSNDQVGWAEVLAAFAFARLATAIPLTPGGVGFVEAVLITTLSAAGGDRDQVAAAVLIYRALTWALPILVGIVCYLSWRRTSIRPEPVTAGGPPVAGPRQ